MDEITHTIMPSGGQWGGAALGAGVGGLLGSWLGNGGFGGYGYRGAGAGTTWTLVKSASSGMGEIPDPAAINITDYWNHEYPGSNGKVFLYVVEGIRLPKTQRETACRVLYAWFSTVGEKGFTPQMIRPGEWLTANVYAAGITDARVSKLHAICKTKPEAERPREPAGDNTPPPLIKMEDLINDGNPAGADGRNAPDNPGERRKNNR